jgi:hypothetical protein
VRNFGIPQIQDLTSDGSTTVAVTPGASVQPAEFTVQAPRSAVGSQGWPLAAAIIGCVRTSVDQPGTGSLITWDDLPRILDSVNVQSPLFGTTHPRESFTGPVLKHCIEFLSRGYNYTDGARNQIPIADGDTVVDQYFVIPFAQETLNKPHHCSPWLGWLQGTKITFNIGATTCLDAVSTGVVIEATTNVRCWIEYFVSNELVIPTIAQFHVYDSPAAGGSRALLQGIGSPNGLSDVKDASRLAALFELTDIKGMGAADGADNITSVSIPQLGQDVTTNIDAYFAAYRALIGGHKGPVSGNLTTIIHDRAGNPETMVATPNATMNTATAMYTPYRAPGRNSELTKIPKFFGDLQVIRTFTAAPASGRHRFLTLEYRELGEAKKKELIGRTGKGGGTMERIFLGKMPERAGELAALPQRVRFGG